MQTVLVYLAIAAAFCYATWRFFRLLRNEDSPCQGCEQKKSCRKFGYSREK